MRRMQPTIEVNIADFQAEVERIKANVSRMEEVVDSLPENVQTLEIKTIIARVKANILDIAGVDYGLLTRLLFALEQGFSALNEIDTNLQKNEEILFPDAPSGKT